jgi:inosine-uridine nucleoside N-ribohydrolase
MIPLLHQISRGAFWRLATFITTGFLLVSCTTPSGDERQTKRPIPVIYDSDVGDDIDDTWAVGFLLRCPELDVKMVMGDYGKPDYRARLFAKFLERTGRTDIPVGIGVEVDPTKRTGRQWDWVKDYDLKNYPGKIHTNGVQAMIDLIMNSKQQVTVIAVGPAPNIAEALRREPRIAQRARFVGMHGSVASATNPKPVAEYNVVRDPKSLQHAFTAPWDIIITPLNTCAQVVLKDDKYQRIYQSNDPIAKAIVENYRHWLINRGRGTDELISVRSSTLFDTVAVYLTFRDDLLNMEQIGLRVTDDGFTVIDPTAKQMAVAMTWKDLGAFEDFLVERLTNGK